MDTRRRQRVRSGGSTARRCGILLQQMQHCAMIRCATGSSGIEVRDFVFPFCPQKSSVPTRTPLPLRRWSAPDVRGAAGMSVAPVPELQIWRERQIAAAFAEGETYQMIADRLNLAPSTVRTLLATIYRKLGVSSKLDLRKHIGAAVPSDPVTDLPPRPDKPSIAVLRLRTCPTIPGRNSSRTRSVPISSPPRRVRPRLRTNGSQGLTRRHVGREADLRRGGHLRRPVAPEPVPDRDRPAPGRLPPLRPGAMPNHALAPIGQQVCGKLSNETVGLPLSAPPSACGAPCRGRSRSADHGSMLAGGTG